MECKNCNAQLEEGVTLCPQCGTDNTPAEQGVPVQEIPEQEAERAGCSTDREPERGDRGGETGAAGPAFLLRGSKDWEHPVETLETAASSG